MRVAKSRPVLLACVSDIHAGGTTAVCPPTIMLDDGGEYVASKAQRWLWQNWLDFWERVEIERNERRALLYTVVNGDAVEGDHHGTTQIMSGNPTAQAAALNACMEPVLDVRPDKMFFVRGTEAHVGKSACHEERIALGLLKDKRPVVGDPSSGTASHWHLRMEIQGKRLDFAHHGRFGARPWSEATGPNTLAVEIGYVHQKRGEPHPDLAVRSHFHRFFDTYKAHPVRLIQMPAWQLATSHVHRIDPAPKLADIGGILITIEDGRLDVIDVLYKPDPAPVWKAS